MKNWVVVLVGFICLALGASITKATNTTRKGLQLSGNGYLVYSSSIPANTSSLVITGTISSRAKHGNNQIIVGIRSRDDKLQATFAASKYLRSKGGDILMSYYGPPARDILTYDTGAPRGSLTDGLAFNFTVTLSMTRKGRDITHLMKIDIAQWTASAHSYNFTNTRQQWDFENARIYVGGYPNTRTQLSGCVSDVMVSGTNIIDTYFSQSPSKHTNPLVSGGPLPEKAEFCNSTVRVITKPSGTARVFPMKQVVTILCFIACISFNQ